jgi:hypothetical protein
MRTSEIDPSASGEIEIGAPMPRIIANEKKVIVDRRSLLPIRKPRALTVK